MGSVYSRIDDCDDDSLTCRSGPSKFRTHALQAPLLMKPWIVGGAPRRGRNENDRDQHKDRDSDLQNPLLTPSLPTIECISPTWMYPWLITVPPNK